MYSINGSSRVINNLNFKKPWQLMYSNTYSFSSQMNVESDVEIISFKSFCSSMYLKLKQ